MSMFNDSVTIVNHYVDESDQDCYQETVLTGVCWQYESAIEPENGGYGNNSKVLVIIPQNALYGFIADVGFDALPDKTGWFTLREGDKIRRESEEITITGVKAFKYGKMAHMEVRGV